MRRALFLLALLGLSATRREPIANMPIRPSGGFRPMSATSIPATSLTILSRIQGVFRTTQNAYWKQDLQLTAFDRVRELSLRGNGTEYIPRRFCIARGHFSDDSVHTVIYDIEESQGIIGFGDGVEWCVVGLDRMFAFSPACSTLRPFAERTLGSKALVERY